jgi:hypothetical protein
MLEFIFKKESKYCMFIFVLCFAINCKNNQIASKPLKSEDKALAAEFEEFYDRFGKDSVFQIASIVFPLEGRPTKSDGVDTIPENFHWEKKDWLIHKTYDDGNGTYTREFMSIGDIVTEHIQDKSGQFTMERRFAKTSDGWKLIYYKEMGL